jgi:thioredoxin-related protein
LANTSRLIERRNRSNVAGNRHGIPHQRRKMNPLLKKIEVVANVAIIVTSALCCLVLVKSSLLKKSSQEISTANVAQAASGNKEVKSAFPPGTKISLTGIDFARNDRTLLMALSTTCHFCSESAEFYKTIAKERGGTTRLIAVLPQPLADSRNYLDKLGVPVDEIIQAQLSDIRVRGTPTLILIDHNGDVIDYWVGKLSDIKEPEVIGRLREARSD